VQKSVSPLCLLLWVGVAFSQDAAPAFEAATVKPSKAERDGSSWDSRPGYLVMKNQTLGSLIRIAYHLRPEQVAGGPKWVEADRFDVEARAQGPADDPKLLAMLQTLLTERFQLATHRDTKAVQAYALLLAKDGMKIRPDATEGHSSSKGRPGVLTVERITMAKLADTLSRMLRMGVTDQTNATGTFTFTLEYDPASTRPAPASPSAATADAPAAPSIFTALQHQLGVKLEGRKEQIEVTVIDKAEKPADN
jgi:uncharacterized protein (TIGR03435 family)